jgi:hypothetical protein
MQEFLPLRFRNAHHNGSRSHNRDHFHNHSNRNNRLQSFAFFTLSFLCLYIMHFPCQSRKNIFLIVSHYVVRVYDFLTLRRGLWNCSILPHTVAFCTAFCYTTFGGRRKSLSHKGLRRIWPAVFVVSPYSARVYVKFRVSRGRLTGELGKYTPLAGYSSI